MAKFNPKYRVGDKIKIKMPGMPHLDGMPAEIEEFSPTGFGNILVQFIETRGPYLKGLSILIRQAEIEDSGPQ